MNRRGFLIGATAALAAPAIVRASSLMPIAAPKLIVPDAGVWTPPDDRFFDIVTYTGNGRELWTLPHSVFGRPEFILIRARNKP